MYLPPAFAEDRIEVKHGLIRAYPLGTLIVNTEEGPSADLIPFMLYPDEGEHGVLRAHVARANPVWKALADGASVLAVFQGPEAYISPNWYETKRVTGKAVPTWNYAMVQVRGTAHAVEDTAWLRRLLDDLTNVHEQTMPEPWSVSDAPPDYMATMLRAIVGIELPIASIKGKWKVSQNREIADRANVAEGLRERGAAGMAALVAERITRD
jgi:transcriptional regulator